MVPAKFARSRVWSVRAFGAFARSRVRAFRLSPIRLLPRSAVVSYFALVRPKTERANARTRERTSPQQVAGRTTSASAPDSRERPAVFGYAVGV